MRLSELVSSLGLWIFPVVGLIGFVSAFAFVLARVAGRSNEEMDAHAAIPLGDTTEGND